MPQKRMLPDGLAAAEAITRTTVPRVGEPHDLVAPPTANTGLPDSVYAAMAEQKTPPRIIHKGSPAEEFMKCVSPSAVKAELTVRCVYLPNLMRY
jgi:hypothetical protein